MKVELLAFTTLAFRSYDLFEAVGFQDDLESRDCECLIEFAGRECYQSWNNPAGRTNAEYIRHILECGHGSVLEHASATFRISGISRSCSHELVRHRAGTAFSQLSQRYVSLEDSECVIPPAIRGDNYMEGIVRESWSVASDYYDLLIRALEMRYEHIENKTERRKAARQAARCVMPNCCDTSLVMTANFRAWRHIIAMRGSAHADAEIRELAVELCRQLKVIAPAVFQDCQVIQLPDGSEKVEVLYVKV